MAAGWPTVSDVQNLLRVESGVTGDDTLVAQELAAAIAWTTSRVEAHWVDVTDPSYLADDLFAVALHEAARLYRRRDSIDGTVGWGDMGVVRIGPKDPDIESLLGRFLAVVVG